MKRASQRKIPILDIPGLSAFQSLHRNPPELELQGSRVVCLFNANQTFYALSERFNSNELVSVIDFLNAQRQLKAQMFALKAGVER